MNEIKKMHEKYFGGETTREEEMLLRRYFCDLDASDEQSEVRPLFTYFAEEASVNEFLRALREDPVVVHKNKSRSIRILKIASLAASLLLGVIFLNRNMRNDYSLTDENSVWINGEKITQIHVVRSYAKKSFEKVKSEEDLLEEQLRFVLE